MGSLLLVLLAAASSACVTTMPVATAPAPITRQLEAETRITMGAGAVFTAPKQWFVTTGPDLAVLQDPERALTVTIVEVQAPSGREAAAAAWKRAKPDFARRVRRVTEPLPDPWDEIVRIEYESTAAEAWFAVANARRAGATWYVMLIDGPLRTFDRRAAQINTAFTSFRAPGVRAESWRGRTPRPFDAALAARFDEFVEQSRTRAGVPGASVAIVQGGRVVYAKGFGAREAGQPEPVTPDTLFMIGSISKPLTSLMMAALVDRGQLAWNTPVVQLLPSFALGDADATKRLTLQHTVCACTGLPRQDMEFFFNYARATPESRLAELRTMTPTTGFGETFQYSNALVSAGGYVAARAYAPDLPIGAAYDRAMQHLVYDPLGMTRTTTDFAAVERTDHARPHALDLPGRYVPLTLSREGWLPAIRPAGGVWSSAHDMARYVLAELGNGTLDGRTIVSPTNLMKRREPQVKVNSQSSYALALGVDRMREITVIGHGGSTSGFSALMFFLPDHDVGGIVLSNAWGAFAFTAAVRGRLLELLFDGREQAARGLEIAMRQRADARRIDAPKVDITPTRDQIAPFVGTYENRSLGRVVVRLDGERAILDAGDWRSAIGRKVDPDGTVRLVLLDPPWTFFELVARQVDGRPRLSVERAQQTYVFAPVP